MTRLAPVHVRAQLAPACRYEYQQPNLQQLQRVQHHGDGDGQGEVHPTGDDAFKDAESPRRCGQQTRDVATGNSGFTGDYRACGDRDIR